MQEEFEDEDDNKCLNIEPFVVKVIGTDQAEYTLEIFMRDVISCLTKRDLARKTDARAPIAYCYCRCGSKGVRNQAHAIIPTNQKLMLYVKGQLSINDKEWDKENLFYSNFTLMVPHCQKVSYMKPHCQI